MSDSEGQIDDQVFFFCNICPKKYSRPDNLNIHINEVHKGLKKKCIICNKEMRGSSFRRHLKTQIHRRKLQSKYAKKPAKKMDIPSSEVVETHQNNGLKTLENDPFIVPIQIEQQSTSFDMDDFIIFEQ